MSLYKDILVVNQSATNLVDNQTKNNIINRACLLCGLEINSDIALCTGCIQDLPYIQNACPYCATPTIDNGICGHCINYKKRPLNNCVALFRYQYPVNLIIREIKFNNGLVYAKCLGQLLANKIIASGGTLPECIVPVPLHFSHLRHRGYNQALEIARPLAQELSLPLAINNCTRQRQTKPQTDLKINQRKHHVRNAFSTSGITDYQHIAIIDDVMTTGATINELARMFIGAGITRIDAWVCARAVSSN